MNANERRQNLINILKNLDKPIKGDELAKKFNVSRQVIVQDIALIRAKGIEIMATPQGYITYNTTSISKVINCKNHKDSCSFYEELKIIVDLGGKVKDVIVEHPLYGEIKVNLDIESNRDINEFINKASSEEFKQLSLLTKENHMHTIEAKDEEILGEIIEELEKRNLLFK
ncbi:3H domain-containing protein [Romboutsia sp.]|uniref:3H domain-containing protein n=1 Tax=Romboutsia sp. TaxID=1965302 RepID=UPI003F3A9D4E